MATLGSTCARAGFFAIVLAGAGYAHAQQPAPAPAAAPQIPPSWAQGRPADQENSPLAPHPPGMTALPGAEIPLDQIKLPAGFHISLWAEGMPNAREMTVGRNGTVFASTRFVGNVYAVVDKGGRREVKIIARGLHRPNGVAYKNGALYVAELSRILRYDDIENRLDDPPAPVVVFDKLPKDEAHGWKFMKLGPDGKLYFNIGSPGNILIPPYTHAQIVRLDPDTRILETVARGVRNSVGMDFHPQTKELWFTNNGRDWVSDDMPNDTLHRVSRPNMNFGFPFCHQGDFVDPEFGSGHACSEFDPPAAKLGPHVASLGMRFYTGNMFPKQFKNNIFIAEHGSWNRTKKTGYNISRVSLDKSGKVTKVEVFAQGWLQGENFWGRPADVQVLADGSMLVSDDVAGAIYRIDYAK
jgi:glucose/arabinose dehydrogenase